MAWLVPHLRETSATASRSAARAFTLVEILVVIAIVAVLLAILLPAMSSVRAATKTVVCSSNVKSIAMDFQFFAMGQGARGRGDSSRLPGNRFWINDFQDSQYGLDEFWDARDAQVVTLTAAEELMLCPAGATALTKRKGFPCGPEAISPIEDVSLAVNMRLYRAVVDVRSKKLLASPWATRVNPRVLDRPYVPLIMDADGRKAAARGIEPFYSAPPAGAVDPYASGRYWFPAQRHAGRVVVGFVGGHVLTSAEPERENWHWSYQAEAER